MTGGSGYVVRYYALRAVVLAIAAAWALASCGRSQAAPPTTSPTPLQTVRLENRPLSQMWPGQIGKTPIPNAPPCDMRCAPPTATPSPTLAPPTPTPIPPTATPTAYVEAQTVATPTPMPYIPPPTVSPPPTPPDPPGIDGVLEDAGWPPSLLPWAEYIIGRESGDDPGAVNSSSGADGWFQILPSTWASMGCTGDPLDAHDNAVCAWALYGVAGVTPWAIG